MMRALRFALVLGLSVAGCGDDDGGGSSGPPDAGMNSGGDAASAGVRIDTVSPPEGRVEGHTNITLIGAGFSGGETMVLLDGRMARDVLVLSDAVLTFVAPAADEPRQVDITVYNANGFDSIEDGFIYHASTRIDRVDPPFGPLVGGNTVTLHGAGFQDFNAGNATVTVDGEAASNVAVVDDGTITLTAPGGTVGQSRSIAVTTNYGAATRSYVYLGGLIAADGQGGVTGSLYVVNPSNAAFTEIMELERGYTGLAFAADGTLYGVESDGNCCGGSRQLWRIDPGAQQEIPIGVLGQQVADIAFHQGELYGWSESDDGPVRIDLDTGLATPLGGGTGSSGSGTASDGATLFVIPDDANGFLYSIDTSNGVTTQLLDIDGATSSDGVNALTVHDGALYGVRKGAFVTVFDVVPPGGGESGAAALIRINPKTGAVAEVGALPAFIDALAAVPGSAME